MPNSAPYPPSPPRHQSLGEEIANSVNHGVGLLSALVVTPFLIVSAVARGDAAFIAGACVFALSMVALYGASMVYHALPRNRAKQVAQQLDHGAIFLLIAGTYTPFTLGVLRGAWGWTLFGLVWALAVTGVALKATNRIRHPHLSTGLYLLMGWLVVIAIKPLMASMPAAGLAWLVMGGVAYTAGVVFFAADARWRYAHFVWHLFVMAGTSCHFVAVYAYAA